MIINGKKMETARFLYNLDKESHEELLGNLRKKLMEFLSWYGRFQNTVPINSVKIFSSDFNCENSCKRPIGTVFSVIDVLFSKEEVVKIMLDLAPKYNLQVEPNFSTDINNSDSSKIKI